MKRYKILIVAFYLFFCNHSLNAQQRYSRYTAPEGYLSAGFQLNAMNYFGDVYANLSFTRPNIAFFISRKISPHLHFRLSFSWGRIQGDDAKTPVNSNFYARNFNFRNDIKELAVIGVYEILPSYARYEDRRRFSPYLLAGLALFHHNPKAQINGSWVDLQPLGTEGQGRPGYANFYSKIQIAMPLGVGIRFRLSDRADLSLETGFRILFTDYIDDVSGLYPDKGDLASDLAKTLSGRSLETTTGDGSDRNAVGLGNAYGISSSVSQDGRTYQSLRGFEAGRNRGLSGLPNDIYIVTGFHLSYIIDTDLKCPQFYKTRRTVY